MRVEISIASTERDGRVFLGWTPVQATARLIDGPGPSQTVHVALRNAGVLGKVVFDLVRSHRGAESLELDLSGDGSPARFWVAGAFGSPSADFGDAVIEVVETATSSVLSSTPLMVRVRKNAQTLSASERERFVSAFGILNGQGMGRFTDFRDMHVLQTLDQSHSNWGFLPWHRAYLLDLERELQSIDATVTVPYWRFEAPAPAIFTREFMGVPNATGRVVFVNGHPFQQWTTEGMLGIVRGMAFPANSAPTGLRTETRIIALGGGRFQGFGEPFTGQPRGGLEYSPHGGAHTSFGSGWIISPPTAPRDPLFFLLHANVDRIWAKWQWYYKRSNDADLDAYYNGPPVDPGHNIGDSMWPWNGVITPPRPKTAPGGALAASTLTTAPGPSPTVRSMLDFQAVVGGAHLGFAYDDVPFEMPDPTIADAGSTS